MSKDADALEIAIDTFIRANIARATSETVDRLTKENADLRAKVERRTALLSDGGPMIAEKWDISRVSTWTAKVRAELATNHAEQPAACETCGGAEEIDTRLGGAATGGMVPCPDCQPVAADGEGGA